MFMVTGSQADRADKNKITLLKVSDLNKTHVKAGIAPALFLFSICSFINKYYFFVFNKNLMTRTVTRRRTMMTRD